MRSARSSSYPLASLDDLRQLQTRMAAALMQPLNRQDRLKRQTKADFIKSNDRLSSFQRLEIYARQYWFRLLDCLYDDYPALRTYLGASKFIRLCESYLAKHPSSSWTLRNLGSGLPAFIKESGARDIAKVEWAQTLAFDELGLPPLCMEDLMQVDPMHLRLSLQPCVLLLELDHAADRFITSIGKSMFDTRAGASQAKLSQRVNDPILRRPPLKKENVHLVVHRHQNQLYFKRLDRGAWSLLASLRDGSTLQDAVQTAFETSKSSASEFAQQVQLWFAEYTQLGWFTLPQPQTYPHPL